MSGRVVVVVDVIAVLLGSMGPPSFALLASMDGDSLPVLCGRFARSGRNILGMIILASFSSTALSFLVPLTAFSTGVIIIIIIAI